MSLTFRVFDARQKLDDAVFLRLYQALQKHSERPRGIMLSGGSTPLPVYQRLAAEPPRPGPNLHLMFTDDRRVPASSSDSNYGNTQGLIQALGLADQAVLRVNPELDLHAAATDYANQLHEFFTNQGALELAILGVGDDGHTCSLFSEDAARIDDVWAIPVPAHAGFERVSVTAPILEKAEQIIFFVAGQKKAHILKQLRADPLALPAGIAVQNCANVEVWTDVSLAVARRLSDLKNPSR